MVRWAGVVAFLTIGVAGAAFTIRAFYDRDPAATVGYFVMTIAGFGIAYDRGSSCGLLLRGMFRVSSRYLAAQDPATAQPPVREYYQAVQGSRP